MDTVVFHILSLCLLLALISNVENVGPGNQWPPPPKWQEKAKTARYLVHYADWGVVSALSPEYGGVPFGSLQSFVDGPLNNSTGIPYFFIASISDTYHNMKYNNNVAFTLTEASSNYCDIKKWDPEEPVCSRITLLGKMVQVTDSQEKDFVKVAMFARHPDMKDWPTSHNWDFYKLDITHVHLLDYFGGATHVQLQDYFSATP